MEIDLKHNLWDEGGDVRLNLPDNWRVSVLEMNGDRKKVLPKNEIRQTVLSLAPIVKDTLKDEGEICIVFDDLSRRAL